MLRTYPSSLVSGLLIQFNSLKSIATTGLARAFLAAFTASHPARKKKRTLAPTPPLFHTHSAG